MMQGSEPARALDEAGLLASSIAVIEGGQAASGAYVASPTFSQYGYSWLRDGAFMGEAMDLAGRIGSSSRFHHWVARVVDASAAGLERAIASARRGQIPGADDYLHCRYHLDGTPADDDWPTFQLDGPGIWLWSLAHHLRSGGVFDDELRTALVLTSRYLAILWATPCSDAWEEFPEHVHTSTLAGIRAGLDAAVWMEPGLMDDPDVHAAAEGLKAQLEEGEGPHTKWSGSHEVDGSLLWMAAPYGSVSPSQPRFAATLRRVERDLVTDGSGVHRYPSDTFYGGGAWPVLTSALGRVLLRRNAPGDRERAVAALRWIEAQADDDGLLPEQVATNAFAPARIDEWRKRWGESARPLLWSHAAYIALRIELDSGSGPSPVQT